MFMNMPNGLHILLRTHYGDFVENALNSVVESNFDTNRRREFIIFLYLQLVWERLNMIKPHFITSCERFMQLGIGMSDKEHNFKG